MDASWTFAPAVLAALAGYGLLYGLRWRVARREGGARAAGAGRAVLWAAGIAALFAALVSPLDRLGEQFATFHMVQHLLIADLAPICLTLALTKWILRPATRRSRGRTCDCAPRARARSRGCRGGRAHGARSPGTRAGARPPVRGSPVPGRRSPTTAWRGSWSPP